MLTYDDQFPKIDNISQIEFGIIWDNASCRTSTP
jgi:hypothetical protein